MVTRSSSCISGSIEVPITTVASSEAMSLIMPPTSPNSPIDKSGPAVTFTKIPRAPRILVSSNNGLLKAFLAASEALVAPVAEAAPIIA